MTLNQLCDDTSDSQSSTRHIEFVDSLAEHSNPEEQYYTTDYGCAPNTRSKSKKRKLIVNRSQNSISEENDISGNSIIENPVITCLNKIKNSRNSIITDNNISEDVNSNVSDSEPMDVDPTDLCTLKILKKRRRIMSDSETINSNVSDDQACKSKFTNINSEAMDCNVSDSDDRHAIFDAPVKACTYKISHINSELKNSNVSTKAGQGSSTKAKAKKKGGDSTKKSLDIDIISHNVPSRVTRSTSKLTNSEDCEKNASNNKSKGPKLFPVFSKKRDLNSSDTSSTKPSPIKSTRSRVVRGTYKTPDKVPVTQRKLVDMFKS